MMKGQCDDGDECSDPITTSVDRVARRT